MKSILSGSTLALENLGITKAKSFLVSSTSSHLYPSCPFHPHLLVFSDVHLSFSKNLGVELREGCMWLAKVWPQALIKS